MNNLITRKLLAAGSIKGIDSAKRIITAYASTSQWDRYGERFEPDAFKAGLENYKKNPVVLFAHDYQSPPIAKTIGYDFDGVGLILTMQFADTPMARDIFSLYEGGFMNAFSVGFRPLEIAYEERVPGSGEMGAVFKQAELLENSAVPVPANPGALVKKGLMAAAQRVIAPDCLTPKEWTDFEASQAAPEPGSLSPELAKMANDGRAPDLATSLQYLIGLGKMLKHKGKVEDEGLRSLLIQTNNICRELIYGPGAARIEPLEGELSEAEIEALVKEYEVMSELVLKSERATEEDRKELVKIAELIEKAISGK